MPRRKQPGEQNEWRWEQCAPRYCLAATAAAAQEDQRGVPTDDGDFYHFENWSSSEDEDNDAVEVLRHVDDPRDDMLDTDEEDQGDLTAQAEEDEREQSEEEEEDEDEEEEEEEEDRDEQHVLFQ